MGGNFNNSFEAPLEVFWEISVSCEIVLTTCNLLSGSNGTFEDSLMKDFDF